MNSPPSYSKHSDKKVDELFEKQKRTLDPAARKKATADFERYAIDAVPQRDAVLVAAHRRPPQAPEGLGSHLQPLHRQ